MKKSEKVEHNLGNIIAFVANSDADAELFRNIINAETSGKVLSLTMTYDGYWISVDDGHPKIASLAIDLGRATPGINVACVIPSKEKLVGGEVLGPEGAAWSLIRKILQLPDPGAVQPTLADAIACIEKHITWVRDEIERLSEEVNDPDYSSEVVSNMKVGIENDHHEHACLCFVLNKLKGEL